MLAHARPCLLAPANVYECFHMLANACDSYDHLSALPVQMLRQVSPGRRKKGGLRISQKQRFRSRGVHILEKPVLASEREARSSGHSYHKRLQAFELGRTNCH